MELHNSCKTGLIMTNLVHARQAEQQRLPAWQFQYTGKTAENHVKFSIVRTRLAMKTRPDKLELR